MNKTQYFYLLLALISGGFLAAMIFFNSQLALFYSPAESSWFAHGIGGLTALILIFSLNRGNKQLFAKNDQTPWWAYLGGLPGAFTVLLSGITVNSHLGLTGSLALGLVGQISFSYLCDYFGLFGLEQKKMALRDLVSLCLICGGSLMIIFSRGAI
ncbi:hypothetical protein SOPP22_04205 [Shewanella sp. OPT22]|nr:hypothetical protein SOPP22_04205 [Shewanella sp. OPT22]